MSIEELRAKNPSLKIYSVSDPEFSDYGRIVEGLDTEEISERAKGLPAISSGSSYIASIASFEALDIFSEIEEKIFGTLPSQLGICYGHNSTLGAAEWHSCSELNIAFTPLALMLGRRSDIKDGVLSSSDMKIFYIPKGCVLEVYATTLHFCPIEVEAAGFSCAVGLTDGTNTPLEAPTDDKLLFRKNKWIMAHTENAPLIARGVVPAIVGENYKINY